MLLVIIWTAISVSLVHSRGFPEPRDEILKEPNQLPQLEPFQTEVEVRGLKRTLRSDTFSQLTNFTYLWITNGQLAVIENGVCRSAPNIKQLIIMLFGSMRSTRLTKEMFANCDHLKILDISLCCDDLLQVDIDILQNTPNLKELELWRVNLKSLEKKTLKNLESLRYIKMCDCGIQDIDPAAFDSLKKVHSVDVSGNNLTTIPRGLFKNTPNLTYLDLSHNKISGLTWDEFDGLTALKTLKLEGNEIRSFDAEKIARYLPKLETFSFADNPIECNSTDRFADELKSKFNQEIRLDWSEFSKNYC